VVAVGDQKVCIYIFTFFKYFLQTFWNTNSGGYSSAKFYYEDKDEFGFLENYMNV